jgi:hypothetical protein
MTKSGTIHVLHVLHTNQRPPIPAKRAPRTMTVPCLLHRATPAADISISAGTA